MTASPDYRRFVYHVLILVAFAVACGRIVCCERIYEPSFSKRESDPKDRRSLWPKSRPEPMPSYGSNDRSRWATVRALVDEGTYVIGKRDRAKVAVTAVTPVGTQDPFVAFSLVYAGFQTRTVSDSGIIFEDGWQSVDKVLNPDTLEFFSSKPPLLSTLVAGLYWLLQKLTGWTLAENPFDVIRTLLLLINALPFLVYLCLLSRIVEMYGKTEWGRLYVVAAGCFGTLVHPFLVTFSNHTAGTVSVMVAWYLLIQIWRKQGNGSLGEFFGVGLFSAFAVVNELPALAFAAAAAGLVLLWNPVRAILGFIPAALIVACGFFFTNYQATGSWEVAYDKFGTIWYEYEGSHWRKPPKEFLEERKGREAEFVKTGIDFARFRESRADYATHVLVGHHGVLSLTPIWIFSFLTMLAGAGMAGRWIVRLFRPGDSPDDGVPRFALPLGFLLTVVVIGFYLVKSDNYGGFCIGLRWLMWLTPIWLTALVPAADWLARRPWTRNLALLALAVSVFSNHYSLWNPWRHPWIFDLMLHLGWKGY